MVPGMRSSARPDRQASKPTATVSEPADITGDNELKRIIGRLKRSLSARLLLIFTLTSASIAIIIFAVMGHGFASQWRGVIQPHIFQYLKYVNNELGNPPGIEAANDIAARLPINIYIVGPTIKHSTNNRQLDLSDIELRERPRLPPPRDKHRPSDHHPPFKIGEYRDRTILASRLADHWVYYELPHRDRHRDGFVGKVIAGILLLLGLLYLLMNRMLRPVQDIKLGVQKMGAGELDYRVPIRADNDLGNLATSINRMAEDIEQMLDAKRQLLLGASHELRSPLTRAKVAISMLDDAAKRDSLLEDLDEMERLIGDILESERMNTSHAPLTLEQLHLPDLIDGVVDELAAHEFDVDYADDLPPVTIDNTRIRLLLRNLINNARRYGQNTEKSPAIRAKLLDEQLIRLTIRDFGPGIDPAHLPNVTEPFYRADPARARETGGYGLGLYLCRLIAQAHGGSLVIECPPDGGTEVAVTLPVARQV